MLEQNTTKKERADSSQGKNQKKDSSKSESNPSKSRYPQRSYQAPNQSDANQTPVALQQEREKGTSKKSEKTKDKAQRDVQCYKCKKYRHYANEYTAPDKKGLSAPDIKAIAVARPSHPSPRKLQVVARIQTVNGEREARALIDTGATDDFISQMLVKELGLPSTGEIPVKANTIDSCSLFIYRSVDVPFTLKDSLRQKHLETRRMLAVEMPGDDIVLGWLWLKEIDSIICF